MTEIPVINLSSLLNTKSSHGLKHSTALEIDQACREVGFFYVSNHGLDLALMQQMLDSAKFFFDTAMPEEKDAIAIKKAGDGIGDLSRGYQCVDGGHKGSHEVS